MGVVSALSLVFRPYILAVLFGNSVRTGSYRYKEREQEGLFSPRRTVIRSSDLSPVVGLGRKGASRLSGPTALRGWGLAGGGPAWERVICEALFANVPLNTDSELSRSSTPMICLAVSILEENIPQRYFTMEL